MKKYKNIQNRHKISPPLRKKALPKVTVKKVPSEFTELKKTASVIFSVLKKIRSKFPEIQLPTIKPRLLKIHPPKIKIVLPNLKPTLPHFRFFSKKTLIVFFIFIILLTIFTISYLQDLPSAKTLSTREIPQTTKIYDRNQALLYEIYADQNRTSVPLEKIPLKLRQATIAIEDKDFYKHGGFAVRGILRALSQIIFHGNLQGGSTITQQLIKSALLTPERTIQRKVKEIVLAFWTETLYSKDEILEMYLNQVPYGGTAWGVEAAAETYFNKPVGELDLAESALIAGLPQAPTYYSPWGANPKLAKTRQEAVLRRMKEDGYITKNEEEQAKNEKLIFRNLDNNIKAPHFVMYIKDQLVKKYGEKLVAQGGLKVTTTLDLSLQEYAEATVASEVAKQAYLKVGNGAALVTKPATGEILAMVGSKDYFDLEHDGNVNVTTSLRSPGSSIKPLNYALGFLKKTATPATVFLDVPTCFPDVLGKKYCPGNYDGKFHGPVQARFALGNSYNIPAVKMLAVNGLIDFLATASAMGITTFPDPSRYGLSLTLGGGEVKMIEMATAFGVFANTGIRKDLVSILKVEDENSKILDEYQLPDDKITTSLEIDGKRVLPKDVSYLISHILLDNNARAATFGTGSYLRISGHEAVSVKTGTAEDKRDNWAIGYTPSFLVAVWVGNNDNSPMSMYLESGGSGAAPIWNKIMTRILKGLPDEWPKKPDNIVGATICFDGRLAKDSDCQGKRYEYFIAGTLPSDANPSSKIKIMVDKGTGKPAAPDQKDNIEEREVTVLSDPFSKNICISCPY